MIAISGSRNRLSAAIALQLVEFAHQLGAPGESLAHHKAFAYEACPEESDR
jgi:hypothetical protein